VSALRSQWCTVKVQLTNLLQPTLQSLQIDIVLFQVRVGEAAGSGLFGNLGLEGSAGVEKLPIFLIAIGLEAGDHLLFL
jgi:hypothetical protein